MARKRSDEKGAPLTIATEKGGRAEEILQQSVNVLIRDGYGAFNLRKVAAAVGVRLGTVQYYFATRETLLFATIERVFGLWREQYLGVLDSSDLSPEDRLLELQRLARDQQISTAATRFQLELSALAEHEPQIRALVDRGYLIHRGRIAKLLGEIRPDLEQGHLMAFATLLAAQWEGLSFFTAPDDRARANIELLGEISRKALEGFLRSFRDFSPARTRETAGPG